MDKSTLAEELRAALSDLNRSGGVIERVQECPSSDLVLRTPCYIAFFAAIERADLLLETYRHAEAEIVNILASKALDWPRDINLVLLLVGGATLDQAVARDIVDDQHVCRKFVLEIGQRDLRSVMAGLPFGPLHESLKGESISVVAGVQEVLRGYDPRLIADLMSHSPGVERIAEKIREGSYSAAKAVVERGSFSELRKLSVPPARLKAIEIIDFRGIRRLRPEDMVFDGDVIFVYGPNGVGKTSIADAVEWAITGQIDRLSGWSPKEDSRGFDPIVNVFSSESEARVELQLSGGEAISRVKRGRSIERKVGSRIVTDDRSIIEHVVGARTESAEYRLKIERLRSLFRGSHALSQHDIRQFLERTPATERFDILTTMIGADEYVRFRDKVSSVARRLHLAAQGLSDQRAREERELKEFMIKLLESQKSYDRLTPLIVPGRVPKELAAELVQGLRDYEAIDEESRLKSMEGEFEVLAAYTSTFIRGKNAATEDLLVRLESLQQELPGFSEATVRCNNLRAEIERSKKESAIAHVELLAVEKEYDELRARLQGRKSRQTLTARRHTDLTWLTANLPILHDRRAALRRAQGSIRAKRLELQKAEVALEQEQKLLAHKRVQIEEAEKTRNATTKKEQIVDALLVRLPEVKTELKSIERYRKKKNSIESEIRGLKREKKSTRLEMTKIQTLLNELQRAYDAEAAQGDVLNAFLAKLGELVRSSECPLCGRRYASPAAAREGIKMHLSEVSVQLRDLARRLQIARNDAETVKANSNSTSSKIESLIGASDEVQSSIESATKTVNDFLAECASLGVSISTGKPSAWREEIRSLKKKAKVDASSKEETSVRSAIRISLGRVAKKQASYDLIRTDLSKVEKQRMQVAAAIRGIETEMTQRSLEPSAFSEVEKLPTAVLQAHAEAKKWSRLAIEAEEQMAAVQSAITGLRERLTKANEDIASKQLQLRRYEAICSSFVARCRAVDIDSQIPHESISKGIIGATKVRQALATLEEKRRLLETAVSLERLKRDTNSLAQAETDLKRRVDTSRQGEALMSQWVSSLENLEAEVIKRQVDVIGSHLRRLEPIAQQLYYRLNAHPIFGNVRIKVNENTHGLDIEAATSIGGRLIADKAVSPSAFFSDAQMNSLAITVFLAGALSQQWSAFGTILIDDPIQQMDEMNVVAFLDLLRGLSSRRQFIVFTCNRDFYLLALEKMNCLNKAKKGSFRGYRLEGVAPAKLRVHCDAP